MIFQIYNNFHIRNLFVVLLYLYFSSALYYYITLLAYYLTHFLVFILWYFPCLKAFCIPSTLGTFIISVFRNYCLLRINNGNTLSAEVFCDWFPKGPEHLCQISLHQGSGFQMLSSLLSDCLLH